MSPISLKHPIVEVVFVAGVIFIYFADKIKTMTNTLESKLGMRLFVFLLIFLLGMLSSVITAIIAALVLVEIISVLKLDKKTETAIVIMACFFHRTRSGTHSRWRASFYNCREPA
jgi:predicted cation transporter